MLAWPGAIAASDVMAGLLLQPARASNSAVESGKRGGSRVIAQKLSAANSSCNQKTKFHREVECREQSIRAEPSANMILVVHLAPVSDGDNQHDETVLLDRRDDTVGTDAVTPKAF